MAADDHAPSGRLRFRDLTVIAVGVALWIALVSAGTWVILRATPTGELMLDLERARGDAAASDALLDTYRAPRRLLLETFPRLLSILVVSASIVVGNFIGVLSYHRPLWLAALGAAPLAGLVMAVDAGSAAAWLNAGAVAGAVVVSAIATMRLRRARRRRTPEI